ncbi:WG containing repeat-containing protein [Chryseobacterium ureilyticum]|uniref:WG containing repeat-containing protein n=1 Tax=Chryseobacterium ureilyticum TaxID=373668 RepID=A0A1N7KY04_9FLAO|nr:WG repeat-containing protein [Chryseobacterium ureilyticum]SIS66454.1 WG containing repeat-containing protein [Chryseobacterium ureilyticum]
MKKGIYSLCVFLTALSVKAQIDIPFNLVTLTNHTSYYQTPQDTLLPTYQNGAFIYINQKNGQPAFPKKFREAYPFYGKSALVFDTETQSYNVIDRSGNLLLNSGFIYRINNRSTSGKGFFGFFISKEENSSEFFFNMFEGTFSTQRNSTYGGYPILFKFPFVKNQAGKYVLKSNHFEVDNATPLDENYFMIVKDGKIGIIDKAGTILVPIEYEESPVEYTEKRAKVVNIIPLRKGNTWYYYTTQGKLITTSPMFCHTLLYGQTKLGIYQKGTKFGLLYTDGSTLEKEYDWISEDGLLARAGNDFYFIFEKRIIPYYVKN